MDKAAIQRFAIWARNELIEQVSQRAYQYGIDKNRYGDKNAVSINGRILSREEQGQRKELISRIQKKGYNQVIEEVAYTWFNRFVALRFMEINNYLPSHIRVFSDSNGQFNPEILKDVLHLELEGLDKDKVAEYVENNQTEDLYRYLLLTQCNALNSSLPEMFQKMSNYTEMLLPNNILKPDSVIAHLVEDIPEEDWLDAVQIIGWMYQYYNTELNEQVYDGSMSKSRIQKELLPAATTIYTPDWAIRFMVENSLGRLWIEQLETQKYFDFDYVDFSNWSFGENDDNSISNKQAIFKSKWKYYLDETEQSEEVKEQSYHLNISNKNYDVTSIKVIDPCMGSGHILVYAFDVLMQIYESSGYSQRDAAKNIVEKNLYGLDIDDRAYQLAYFAVMMKGRQYDRRFLNREINPNLCTINESNDLKSLNCYAGQLKFDDYYKEIVDYLIKAFYDAKEYGSILHIESKDYDGLEAYIKKIKAEGVEDLCTLEWFNIIGEVMPNLIKQSKIMSQKYDTIITNPPYLGNSRFSIKLDEYVKKYYYDEKYDLSMVMYKKAIQDYSKENGFIAFITTSSWMSLSSFEKIRRYMLSNTCIYSLVDFGTELFDGKVGHNPIVAWVSRKSQIKYKMTAIRLIDYCYSRRDEKEPEFFNQSNRYTAMQKNFSKIPGSPIAYWVSDNFINNYSVGKRLDSFSTGITSGNKTADNETYLRFIWEVDSNKVSTIWMKYAKGGDFRKWYGNIEHLIDWSDKAKAFYKSNSTSAIIKENYWFKKGFTYTDLTSKAFSCRLLNDDMLFDMSGPGVLFDNDKLLYCIGLYNSIVSNEYFKTLNTTFHYKLNDLLRVPIIFDEIRSHKVDRLVEQNINVSNTDWDSFETSWDFKIHPLLNKEYNPRHLDLNSGLPSKAIKSAYRVWKHVANERFSKLKYNEEELNSIFIEIYGLQDELTPDVDDKDITIARIYDTKEDIPETMKGNNYVLTKSDVVKSFISYAVGCMFGRYSLDVEGLAYAGGEWDSSKYKSYVPDKDNIIPICDDDYFEDDILGRFVNFVRTVYGVETLEENLNFIADALGGKGNSREVIRNYFINDFYMDHLKTYKKRPIYWLFDSGKKNGFKALIYMHRYQSDLLARMRTDYVHEQQERYRTQLTHISNAQIHAEGPEKIRLTKQQKKLQDQSVEIQKYEEKIHHLADRNISIDLDDGVKHNYAIFSDVVAKIK